MVNGFICLKSSPCLVFRFINFGSFSNGFRKIFVLPVTCLLVLQTTWINDHRCFPSCCSHARPGTAFVLCIAVCKKQARFLKKKTFKTVFFYSYFFYKKAVQMPVYGVQVQLLILNTYLLGGI